MIRWATGIGATLVIGVMAAGCELIYAPNRSLIGTGGGGGTGGTTTTTTTSTTGTTMVSCGDAGMTCSDPSGCTTGVITLCVVASCTAGCCEVSNASAGTKCTDNGGAVCDGNGTCVPCNVTGDCTATGTVCATPACNTTAHTCSNTDAPKGTVCTDNGGTVCDGNGTCTPAHCTDGIKDADETDLDCGGATCAPCGDGLKCLAATDCKNKICDPTAKTCTLPSCGDGVQNGDETDKDCGGAGYVEAGDAGTLAACNPCPDTEKCVGNSDCVSLNCQASVCMAKLLGATCTTSAECGSTAACVTDDSNTTSKICCVTSCTVGTMVSCGEDGNCKHDGSACADWSSSTICAMASCAGSTYTAPGTCTGTGTCGASGKLACPGGFICAGATACKVTCASNADCQSGFLCHNPGASGTCVAMAGGACTSNAQCSSNVCGTSGTGTHCCTATCNAAISACGATDCNSTGACVYPGNTVAPGSLQTPGDCQKTVCDGAGGDTSVDDATDLPTSNNACQTNPSCCGPSPLTPCFTDAPTGTACTNPSDPLAKVCGDPFNANIGGSCVECNYNTDCRSINDAGTLACDTTTGTCQ